VSLVKRRIIGSSFPYSAGNVYSYVAPTAAWFTVFERSLTTGGLDGSGWTGVTDRQVILPYSGGGFDRINNGTQLRITLQAPAVGTLSWDKLYGGKGATSGDISDFDGTQVQFLFSGSPSGSVSSGGLITSDAVAYPHDGSSSFVVAMHHTSSEIRIRSSVAGFRRFYTYPGTDTASVTDDTMNNDDGSNLSSIVKIEAFGYGSVETYAVKQFFDRIPTPTSGRATLYRNLINGLVQDGWWSTLDGLYIIAAADSTAYITNLKQTSFGLVESFPSSPGTFVPDQGYTGSAFSNLSTQFNPNVNTGFNFAASGIVILGCYVTTNDPTGTGRTAISIQGTTTDTSILPLFSGLLYASVLANDTGAANTNVRGNYMVSRSNSSSYTRWKNGTTIGSDGGAVSGAFAATAPILIGSGDFQVAAAWFGGRKFGTQAQDIMARVNAYMTALGINVY